MTISANAMSYRMAKSEALFLSDKMAYELNLTAAQYEAVYEINLDYLMSVDSPSDAYGRWWKRRNSDLQYVLTVYQYNKYIGIPYFYRPISWKSDRWAFHVYNQYTNRKKQYTNWFVGGRVELLLINASHILTNDYGGKKRNVLI